jgi:uncharacterized protein YggE
MGARDNVNRARARSYKFQIDPAVLIHPTVRRSPVKKYLALTLCATLLPVTALAQSLQPHIEVVGHAERSIEPDRFHIDIKVEAVDIKPVNARTRVEKNMAKVTAAFRANHAIPESINASTLSIIPHERRVDDDEVVDGTEVTRTASATFTRMEDLRKFIDSLDTVGTELQITGTEMSRSDNEALDVALREDAMRDSTRKAERIAKAYGVKLGSLYTAGDRPGVSGGYSDLESVTVSANTPPPPIDLEVGTIKMQSTIYATFLLNP